MRGGGGGALKDGWQPDAAVAACSNPACGKPFSTVRRRHHCRLCRKIFCDKCSSYRVTRNFENVFFDKRQRACGACHRHLSATATMISPKTYIEQLEALTGYYARHDESKTEREIEIIVDTWRGQAPVIPPDTWIKLGAQLLQRYGEPLPNQEMVLAPPRAVPAGEGGGGGSSNSKLSSSDSDMEDELACYDGTQYLPADCVASVYRLCLDGVGEALLPFVKTSSGRARCRLDLHSLGHAFSERCGAALSGRLAQALHRQGIAPEPSGWANLSLMSVGSVGVVLAAETARSLGISSVVPLELASSRL